MIPDKAAYVKLLTRQRQWVVWYILVSFLLVFTTDPVYDLDNCGQLTLFILFAVLCFFLGFKSFTLMHPVSDLESMRWRAFSMDNSFKVWIMIASVQIIWFSLANMLFFADFNTALANVLSPGNAYQQRLSLIRENTENKSVLGQIFVLTGILYYMFFMPGMVYFNKLSWPQKCLYASGLLFYVLYYISIGTMKGLGDVICFMFVAGMVRRGFCRCFPSEKIRRDFRAVGRKYLYIAAAAVLIYFVAIQISRYRTYDADVATMNSRSFWAHYFPYPLNLTGLAFTGYFSNGYVGLGHAMTQDFVFSHGYGVAPSTITYFTRYAGWENCYQDTYLARSEIATGWPGLMYWSTLFAWLASDLTFFGAALFMLFVGYLWAWAWTKVLFTRSVVAFWVLGELSILIVYIPANNQVMWASRGTWAVLTTILFAVAEKMAGKEYDCYGPCRLASEKTDRGEIR